MCQTISLLERAWRNGFDVCMLTVDTWQLGWRPTDIDIANYTSVIRSSTGVPFSLFYIIFIGSITRALYLVFFLSLETISSCILPPGR